MFKNKNPKQLSTINKRPDFSNHPQLTFTYPSSASSLPLHQPQPSTSPLTQQKVVNLS